MSSTDLDAPPLRLILIAIIIVVGLHVLTAIALVAIKAPEPKTELIKETPPIEIEMVSLPNEPIESVVAEVAETPPSKTQPITEPKSKPHSEPQSEPKPKQKSEAITQEEPVVRDKKPTVQKDKSPQQPPIEKKPVKKIENQQPERKQPDVEQSIADEQRRRVTAQAEKAAQQAADQARAKALQEDIQKANAKAALEAQAQAAENAAKQAAEAAARAEADAKAAAASNEPVNFTASAANWASAPNFSFPERAARRARSGDTLNVVLVLRVNKQGGIDSVRIIQSSGNSLVDKEAQRQVRSGKFKPFTKNGVPVVGNVTLPVAYAVP
ncbi:energy transducer TonB [Psychrobacter sp. ANT_WB68]|uniref:energy transducer TonB n=1 Tax=Psychrobacter sp. ANT_WB68 TaxID=2597355 RepID=UPI0011F0D523|nr:TonB family protein [Psychrobacter sp. ANT_WB68]KAA0915255.1 TonB family protein [Psychrobacter sp. ANT_WB68]